MFGFCKRVEYSLLSVPKVSSLCRDNILNISAALYFFPAYDTEMFVRSYIS